MLVLPALPRLVCRRIPNLLPRLADVKASFWRDCEPVCLVETVSGATPVQATRVRTAWDEREWWLLLDCDDVLPWATLQERDAALWTEEVVEVFIDPIGDGASYFELEINPLGAVCDLVLRRIRSGWRKDFSWHVEDLRSKVQLRPGGWMAELAIPFAALGPAPPTVGTVWRANFFRIDRPGGSAESDAELSAWSPTGLRNFHHADRFGTIHFVA